MWFKKKKTTTRTGQKKEQQACDWLQTQGFKILKQNYLCKRGEIDIIALSTPSSNNESTLVFFEVKYRKNSLYGHPSEFVTPKKQQHIIQCAQLFLLKHPKLTHLSMRFDVITFEGSDTTPNWIKNAFSVLP